MKLYIDGAATEPGRVGILAQKEPFPGGRTFSFQIKLPAQHHGFERWTAGEHDIENPSDSKDILLALLTLYMPDSSGPDRYLLNRVRKLVVEERACTVSGECSDVVHG